MTESREWLLAADDEWHRGDTLEAGRILYERLAVADRPSWAARVLDACCVDLPKVPPEVRSVRAIAYTPARWGDAHEAFQAVRKLVLAAERGAPEAPGLELSILFLAENVAKVTYNASGRPAPFDHNAGWWVAKSARRIVDSSSQPGLEGRVWAALAGQPDPANVNKLDPRDLRLLWVDDYYDGPLSGAVLLAGKLRWFIVCAEVNHHRRYAVYDLSEPEIAQERQWHALFVEHVGDHYAFDEHGSTGTVKPLSEHAKFYDAYAKRTAVDYSRNPILGWFEL
jgi:hypothetical protein